MSNPNDKKFKVIIPARGGSKGVPRKNMRILNGQPLIAYPIQAAQKSKYVSAIYVSTDNQEIADTAKRYGATIIDRPAQYATDAALDIHVMRHAVEHLNDYDDIIHLRATTPMIHSHIIDEAVEYFVDNPECTGLRSAHEAPETAYKSFKKSGEYWEGLFNSEYEGDYYNWPRQELPKTYQPNGCIDIIRPNHFMRDMALHGNKILAFVTPFAHEVDTIDDFKIMEAICG
jgi:CMP-N,N'-diacetyllegionaminic acid synthase